MFITFKDKDTDAVLNQARYTVTGPGAIKKAARENSTAPAKRGLDRPAKA